MNRGGGGRKNVPTMVPTKVAKTARSFGFLSVSISQNIASKWLAESLLPDDTIRLTIRSAANSLNLRFFFVPTKREKLANDRDNKILKVGKRSS